MRTKLLIAAVLGAFLLGTSVPLGAHTEPEKYWEYDPELWEHGWSFHKRLRTLHDAWHAEHPNAGKKKHKKFHHLELRHRHFKRHHHDVLVKRKGTASWYKGQVGACGTELKGFYAAHRKWPCGQLVSVRKGGKHIFVRIQDRGPYVEGRIIDLSRRAFKQFKDPSVGLMEVRIYKLEE